MVPSQPGGPRGRHHLIKLVGTNSIAGYRIGYTAVAVSGTRVGRTSAGSNAVTGEFLIAGTILQTAKFSVEMSKFECDGGSDCTDHIDTIMDVKNNPYETFELSTPVDLHSIPADLLRIRGGVRLRRPRSRSPSRPPM